jgi:hypothetical protein
MGATEIQRRMRLNADGSTGGNTASSIALRSLVGGVRQKFQLVMAAPADEREDEREHAFTIPKFKLRDFSPSSAPADY